MTTWLRFPFGGTDRVSHIEDGLEAVANGGSQPFTATAVKTANYGAAVGDLVPVDTSTSAVTVTLPNAPTDRSSVAVKMIAQAASRTVTVATAGSDVFNKAGGSTTLTLTLLNQGVVLEYVASSGIWYVIADDLALSQLDARYVGGDLVVGTYPPILDLTLPHVFTGNQTAPALIASGLMGATALSRYVGGTTSGPPTSGTFAVGDFVISQNAEIWVCTATGTPGTWKAASRSLLDIYLADLGLLGWNTHPENIATQTALTSQTIYWCAVPVRAGVPITGVKLDVEVASSGTAPTGFYVGLANTTTMLAQSGNLNGGVFSQGIQPYALSAQYTPTADGNLGVVILQNGAFSVTNPSFGRGTGRSAIGSAFMHALAGTLQATLPANNAALPSALTTVAALNFWAAVY